MNRIINSANNETTAENSKTDNLLRLGATLAGIGLSAIFMTNGFLLNQTEDRAQPPTGKNSVSNSLPVAGTEISTEEPNATQGSAAREIDIHKPNFMLSGDIYIATNLDEEASIIEI